MNQLKFATVVGAALCLSAIQSILAQAETVYEYTNAGGSSGFSSTGLTDATHPLAELKISGINTATVHTVSFEIINTSLNAGVTYNDIFFNTSLASADYSAGTGDSLTFHNGGISADGFGKFSAELSANPNGPQGSSSDITLTLNVTAASVYKPGGTLVSGDVLAANFLNLQSAANAGSNDGGDPMYFAAHIYATVASGNTGFMALDSLNNFSPPPTNTPVPSSIVMLVTMLVPAAGFFFYRRRSVAVAA